MHAGTDLVNSLIFKLNLYLIKTIVYSFVEFLNNCKR